jgi:multidrug efflux pump
LAVSADPAGIRPKEDRGAFFVLVNGPEGASYSYMEEYMDEIERRLLPYAESGEAIRVLVRTPRGFGGGAASSTPASSSWC